MLQFLQDFYFSVKLLVFSVFAAQVNYLDGHLFDGFFVETFEGVGFMAEIQVIVQPVGVVLDLLPQLVTVPLSHYQPIDLDRYKQPALQTY